MFFIGDDVDTGIWKEFRPKTRPKKHFNIRYYLFCLDACTYSFYAWSR